jgi:hypothetical protein
MYVHVGQNSQSMRKNNFAIGYQRLKSLSLSPYSIIITRNALRFLFLTNHRLAFSPHIFPHGNALRFLYRTKLGFSYLNHIVASSSESAPRHLGLVVSNNDSSSNSNDIDHRPAMVDGGVSIVTSEPMLRMHLRSGSEPLLSFCTCPRNFLAMRLL